MRYLVSEDVTYEKVWLELQALAWNDAGLRERLARVNAEWRAVLTEAFAEPHRELGIDMPLEALVSLVHDLQHRDHRRAPRRHRHRARGAPGVDRPMAVELTAPAAEQTRARYPDESGYVERDGVRVSYEVYGVGRADRPAPADLVDHPLAALEDADPVPRAPLPRGRVRRARERPLRPAAGRRRRTTSASSRPTRSR